MPSLSCVIASLSHPSHLYNSSGLIRFVMSVSPRSPRRCARLPGIGCIPPWTLWIALYGFRGESGRLTRSNRVRPQERAFPRNGKPSYLFVSPCFLHLVQHVPLFPCRPLTPVSLPIRSDPMIGHRLEVARCPVNLYPKYARS